MDLPIDMDEEMIDLEQSPLPSAAAQGGSIQGASASAAEGISGISGTMIKSDQQLVDFIHVSMLDSTFHTREDKIADLFDREYIHHFFNRSTKMIAADLKFIVDVCGSVGAVVLQFTSKRQEFKGTCFRIGTQFVLTNMHVVDLINEKAGLFEDVFINFDYKVTSSKLEFRCVQDHYHQGKFVPMIFSNVLDYAVLKLVPKRVPLPLSLTGAGFLGLPSHPEHLKEGLFLTFAGHPGGKETCTDISCPVKNPDNLDGRNAMFLSFRDKTWLKDMSFGTYEVPTFLNGASGSPGFLLNEHMLLVMHTRGVCLDRSGGRTVEQGVLMSAIMSDVWSKIGKCSLFKEIFDIDKPQWM